MNARIQSLLAALQPLSARAPQFSLPSFGRHATSQTEPAGSPLKRRIIKAVVYPVVFVAAFTIFFAPAYLNCHLPSTLPQLLQKQNAIAIQIASPKITGVFPPALAATSCTISRNQVAIPTLTFTDIRLTPSISGLLAGRIGINYSAKGFGGTIQGTVGTGSFSMSKIRIALNGEKLDVSQLPNIKQFDNQLIGTANIDLVATAPPQNIMQAEGSLEAVLQKTTLTNIVPVFTTPKIAIADATLDLDFTGPRIKLNTFKVNSDVLQGSLDGTLLITPQNILNTKLNLRGHLLPNAKTTVLGILDPKAVKMIKENKSVSVSITQTLGQANIKLR